MSKPLVAEQSSVRVAAIKLYPLSRIVFMGSPKNERVGYRLACADKRCVVGEAMHRGAIGRMRVQLGLGRQVGREWPVARVALRLGLILRMRIALGFVIGRHHGLFGGDKGVEGRRTARADVE